MRKRAMETLGETKSRTGNGSKEEKKTEINWSVISMAPRCNQRQADRGRCGKKSTRRRKKRKDGGEKSNEGGNAEKRTRH